MRLLCFLLSTLFFVVTSKAQDNDSYKIEISVTGLEDSVAYLGYHYGEKKYLQDTSEVKRGKVVFAGEKDLVPGVYFLYSKSFYLEFIVEEDEFEISTEKGNPYGDMVVNGSSSNELFREFQLEMISHQQGLRELRSSLDSTSTQEDSTSIFESIKKMNVANEEKRTELEGKMGDAFVGQILKLMRLSPDLKFEGDSLTLDERRAQYNDFRKSYFDEIDFTSEGLLRTPIFHSKLMEYVERVTFQNPDSIINSIDMLLKKSESNEALYRYIMVTMFQNYQNPKIMGMDKIFVHISDEYYLKGKASWADDNMIKELKEELVFHRENQMGMQAPQIHLVDTLDKPVRLYDIQADYLVLYFYSPTCGHCKKKTPVLKEVYDKMEGKFEVMAVCTDADIQKWKEFIKDLELDWLNYGDPHLRSNFRVQYNVRSTPVLYVLDKDKRIIAKKLDVDQLEGFIEDQIRFAESDKSL